MSWLRRIFRGEPSSPVHPGLLHYARAASTRGSDLRMEKVIATASALLPDLVIAVREHAEAGHWEASWSVPANRIAGDTPTSLVANALCEMLEQQGFKARYDQHHRLFVGWKP